MSPPIPTMCSALKTCTDCVSKTGCYWLTSLTGGEQFCQYGSSGSNHFHELSYGYQAPLVCPKPPPVTPGPKNAFHALSDVNAEYYYMFLGLFIFLVGLACFCGCGIFFTVLDCVRRRSLMTRNYWRRGRIQGRGATSSSVVSLFRQDPGAQLEAVNAVQNDADRNDDVVIQMENVRPIQEPENEEEDVVQVLRRSRRQHKPTQRYTPS